jgi:hypothetical protein
LFTVDAPVGWNTTLLNEPVGGVIKTTLEEPGKEGTVSIDQEADTSAEERMNRAVQMRSGEPGYHKIATGPQTVDDRETQLFWYEHDEDIGPATVATYFFNAGGFGWRTRAVVAKKAGDSAASAKEIATRMATTLEPR